jgi:hypothetical protein
MADKNDLNLEDDDLGLGDELNFDMDPFAEEPPPANKREATTRMLRDAAKGFKDDTVGDPIKNAGNLAKAAIPKSLSKESDVVFELKDKLRDEVTEATSEIKSQAKGTIRAFEKILPKSEKVSNIANKLMGFIGEDESVESGPTKEQIENSNIEGYINESIGIKTDREAMAEVINQQIERNRFKSAIELSAITASNTESIRKFNNEIANSYFRRSLELQYKSLFTAKEQLSVIKVGMDTFKNQFEAIIKNTSLPDLVKVRNNEVLGATIKGRAHEALANKFYSDDNVVGRIRGNITDKIKNTKDKLLFGMGGVRAAGEQKDMMDDMSGMGVTRGGMAGGILGGIATSKFGEYIGKKVSSNQRAQEGIYKAKNAFMDPNAYFKEQQQNVTTKEDGTEKTSSAIKNRVFSFLEDLTGGEDKTNNITISKTDLTEATSFDGRAYASLTKVIPGLLSKIYGEIKTFRTGGTKPEENEIAYSFNDDTFKTAKELTKDVKLGIKSSLAKDSVYYIDKVIDSIAENGGIKVGDDDLHKELRKGLMSYIMDGGTTAVSKMIDSGLLDHFKPDAAKLFEKGITNTLTKSKKDFSILSNINEDLNNIKSSIPNMSAKVDELNKSGNLHILEDMGLTTTDNITKQKTFNNDVYKKLVLEELSKTKTGDISHLIKEKEDEVKAAEEKSKSPYAGTYKGTIDTLKNAKDKTVTRFKGTKVGVHTEAIKDDVTEKVGVLKDKTVSKFKELSIVEEDALREQFFKSEAYASGKVRSFKEYLEALNYKTKTNDLKDLVSDTIAKTKKIDGNISVNKISESIVSKSLQLKDNVLSKIDEDALRTKFFSSVEYKNGYVQTFEEYAEALGHKLNKDSVKNSIEDMLVKTRSLDKKIFMGGVGIVKSLFGRGSKKLKELTAEQESALRTKYFASVEYKNGTVKSFKEYVNSHGFKLMPEKGLFKSLLGKAKMPKVSMKDSNINGKVDNILGLLKTKATAAKKSIFDSDGDGDRDGNWKDRLTGKKNKAKGVIGGVIGKAKEKADSSLGIGTILAGMAFVGKKLLGVVTKVPKMLGGMLKGITMIPKLLMKLPGLIGGALSGIMGLGKAAVAGYKVAGKVVGKVAGTAAVATAKVAGSAAVAGTKIAGKAALNVAGAATGVSKIKKLSILDKIKAFVNKTKGTILKKFGKRAGKGIIAKLLAKVAARAVPLLGVGLLAYDAAMIAKDMAMNGTDFDSAVSKQLLGFDLFADDAVALDEEGNPIKPDVDVDEAISVKEEVKETKIPDSKIGQASPTLTTGPAVNNLIKHKPNMDAYNANAGGDGTSHDSDRTLKEPSSSGSSTGTIYERGGPLADPTGGFNNIYKNGKDVDFSGFHPTFARNLAAMANEYNELTGEKIPINSGYRSYAYQSMLKRQNPTKAATPGKSPHEYGLAFDTNSSVAEKLDQLGLMKKYGFTRPVGKETWHVEAIGNSLDMNGSKKDPELADKLLNASLGRGGGGWGAGPKGSNNNIGRNVNHQKSIMDSSGKKVDSKKDIDAVPLQSPKALQTDLAKFSPVNKPANNLITGPTQPVGPTGYAKDGAMAPLTSALDGEVKPIADNSNVMPVSKPESKITSIADAKNNHNKVKGDMLIKPMQNSADLALQANNLLSNIGNSLEQSLNVQIRMLETLNRIEKSSGTIIDANVAKEKITSNDSNQADLLPNRAKSTLPEPVISLKRKSNISA